MVTIVQVYENGLVRAFSGDAVPWGRRVTAEILAEAIALCPSGNTGVLRASHGMEQNRIRGQFSAGFSVYNDARHAAWVHEGTGIYGPRRTPIVPVNTEKQKFLHLPPQYGFRWKLTTRGGVPVYDPNDPHGHATSVDGDRSQPWLRTAGDVIAHMHGAI